MSTSDAERSGQKFRTKNKNKLFPCVVPSQNIDKRSCDKKVPYSTNFLPIWKAERLIPRPLTLSDLLNSDIYLFLIGFLRYNFVLTKLLC